MKGFSLSLSDTEMWLLLPVCASLLMAVVGYFLLNAAVDEAAKVTDEDKAALKKEMKDMGEEVKRKAQEKVERDQQLIAARLEREKQSQATTEAEVPSSAPLGGVRRRRAAKARTTASDSSDNDWELVDKDGGDGKADEDADVELPTATDASIEAVHRETNSQLHLTTQRILACCHPSLHSRSSCFSLPHAQHRQRLQTGVTARR
jgi:hypothetical protein